MKHYLYILTLIAGILTVNLFSPLIVVSAPFQLEGGSMANINIFSMNEIQMNEDSNMSNSTNGFFKTIIDSSLGEYAIVDSSKKIVTLKDNAGNVILSTNVVEALKTAPITGERQINSMQIWKGKLVVTVGRGYASVDKKSGEVKWMGSN